MIYIKSNDEIKIMREANLIVRDLLAYLEEKVKPGISTAKLDKLAYEFITARGAKPSFLGYDGFPASICTSVDDAVVHGIPSEDQILEEGQIIGIDVGAYIHGFHGDAARTVAVGKISPEKQRLIDVTRESFFKGISVLKDGVRLGDLGAAIQKHAESNGYSVVRELVGHGIGRKMHEDPSVPNYGMAGHGVKLRKNMTIAVEPMINMGKKEIYVEDDGWTIRTDDGLPSAHYENTLLITEDGYELLTL
jgi:methionyl aminopeptidase